MIDWLNEELDEYYELVHVLKKTEKSEICVLRHKDIADKMIKRKFQGSGDVYQILQHVSHPCIPRIYEVVAKGDTVIVLEEYIDGITLSEELKIRTFPEKETRDIAKSVCEALFALHGMGIIHRDIKPENVMLTDDNSIKLIDYDAAKLFKHYKSSDTHIIGTTGYAAPEQFGITQSDERTDIFSLGIMMNVMLMGEHPSVQAYKGKLKKVIEKCTQIDPRKRYVNVFSLAKDL